MINKARLLKKNRAYSEEFRKELVRLFEQGKYSVMELSRLYIVQRGLIYRWIYKYSQFNELGYRVVEMKQSSDSKVKALEKRIRELEAMVGQKQIKIEFLEEMINVASDELHIDIKKKHSTPPSGGSSRGKKS